ncbi:AraC family transcriptional regulator [Bacteroides sp. 519]|uniref:AraC family transcriptional regulator n=1 Tax=Bacteroides sp. 519 TaxID=2302937 RepID=UPI0013D27E33|nr:helix-turn-helix domain-containing protein [Bacteroides sp. 519]NDV60271.1 AraC family transcriptional regulator [Bacteroides sp. 519]
MNEIRDINFLFLEPENRLIEEFNQNNFIIAEITPATLAPVHNLIKQDTLTLLIVTQGTLSVIIDQETHIAGPNMVIRTIPEHLISLKSISDNFHGKIISVNRDLLNLTITGFSPNTYLYVRQHPVFQLTPSEVEEILELFFLIKRKVKSVQSSSKERVFHCLIMALFYELTGYIYKRMEEKPSLLLSHKENLYKKFLNLLRENIRKEHSVTFYANQLCLTPQYISAVLKELSGMSASKWIDEMLLGEAKLLLFSTENNIQQIADKLYFPDQSSFGKFFKKMTGMSPSNYKRYKSSP